MRVRAHDEHELCEITSKNDISNRPIMSLSNMNISNEAESILFPFLGSS